MKSKKFKNYGEFWRAIARCIDAKQTSRISTHLVKLGYAEEKEENLPTFPYYARFIVLKEGIVPTSEDVQKVVDSINKYQKAK